MISSSETSRTRLGTSSTTAESERLP
jgi:hypothetical protein